MGARTRHLNHYLTYMADIQITRNPLAKQVIVILQDVERDQYQDAIITEIGRVKKYAMVSKQLDMHYVQEWGQPNLLEDVDNPWIITMTITDFSPRIPRMDDQIVIDGIKYSIAEVRPSNREIDGIILLKVYPERNPVVEEFGLASVLIKKDSLGFSTMTFNVSGVPTLLTYYIILADESIYQVPWIPFKSVIALPGTRYRFSYCDSVSVRYSEAIYDPITGEVTINVPDSCPNIVMDCEFVKYIPYSPEDNRLVFVTIDGSIPDRESLLYKSPFPLGEWYRVDVTDGVSTIKYKNDALNL